MEEIKEKFEALIEGTDDQLGIRNCLDNYYQDSFDHEIEELKKLIEALPIHGVVRGGVIEAQSVQLTENDLKWVNSCVTQITPTEPLPAEGVAQNGRGGKVVKFEDPIRKKILKQIIDTTKSF